MARRALFLANHKSRSGAALSEQCIAFLKANDIEPIAPPLRRREDAPAAIERHAGEVERVIVAGGDGSINATLPGLLKTGLPLGVIPAGTANDLAKTLELPTDLVPAIEVAVGDHSRPIDLATVNDIPFVNAASLGLSVSITRALTGPLKKRWGAFAYVIAATKALWQARGFSALIRCPNDGDVALKTVQVVVGNGKYFGTGMTVDQDARIDDATLHLYSVGVYHWWSVLALAPSLRLGTTRRKKSVFNATGAEFEVETLRPRIITADGEIIARTPAAFRVLPGAIRVFLPKPEGE